MSPKMAISFGKISPIRLLALALPGLLAFAAISSYFWLGRVAEEQFRQLAAGMSGRGGVLLEVTEYQRGIFSSRVVTTIQLPLLPLSYPGAQARPTPLLFSHRIQHGPLPLGGPAGLGKPSPALVQISTRLISAAGRQELEPPSFRAETTITLGGRAETRLQIAASEEFTPLLSWGELTAHLLYPADLSRLQGELDWAGCNLELAAGRQLAITGISATFNYRRQEEEQGESPGSNSPTMSGGQRWTGQIIQWGEKSYGPLVLEFNWQNLDQPALVALLAASPYLVGRLTGAGESEMAPATAQLLVEAIPRLLSRSPVLEIREATLNTPDGPADGRLTLAYRGRDNSRLFHPVMLFSGLELELAATAPAALAPHLPGSTPAGDEWSLSVDYREGELIINGRPAPIQAILTILRR